MTTRLRTNKMVPGLVLPERTPEDRPWGLRDFRLRDPDGHLHCFAAEIGAGPARRS